MDPYEKELQRLTAFYGSVPSNIETAEESDNFLIDSDKEEHSDHHSDTEQEGSEADEDILPKIMEEERIFANFGVMMVPVKNFWSCYVAKNMTAIREVYDVFDQNCKIYYSIGKNITLDEMLPAFRGKCTFRMYSGSQFI
ncbi:hypothetical protein ILUMI_14478 [Ignelater luminosus]|uniref:PiggyBac transposable element-derived protein domain-containing protein n=1 Tax=Ignelater luminosus TaxID=2038154 RepID=A0A8K0CQF0_IGNLU|nr:hypothetical protein ILUMI_14478 [Ignelater luminosus]